MQRKRNRAPRPRPDDRTTRDEGSVLVLTLLFIIVGGLVVVPLMNYAMSVMKANTVLSDKTKRVESVKAGLRIALADPVSLYEQCGNGGPNTPVQLAAPQISGQTVTTSCYFVDFATAQSADQQHWGLVATQRDTFPPPMLKGSTYASPNPADVTSWLADISTTSATGKIWVPNLPVHALTRRSSTPFQMPAGFPTCNVYFPGTYTDPITLSGPTFFTSGIYYFENEVRVVGGADVVAGLGAEQGCSDDQEAAFYAVDAPATHNINGLGATFVFGKTGRLAVTNTNGGTIGLRFNQRYVQPGDDGVTPSEGVSIASVNGISNAGVGEPLHVPDVNYVPLSLVGSTNPTPATASDYVPSTLTAATMTPPSVTPIIDITLTNIAAVEISVPGYVSVPQGIVKVLNPHSRAVVMAGGVLAATFDIVDARAGTPAAAQSVDIGFLQSIVQRTFRIVSTNGITRSTAVVQVNQNGAYAVNSWEVQ